MKEGSFASPISKVERHISDKYCAIVCAVCAPIRAVAEVNKLGRGLKLAETEVNIRE